MSTKYTITSTEEQYFISHRPEALRRTDEINDAGLENELVVILLDFFKFASGAGMDGYH
jgi:hypothetical protein